GAEGQHRRAVQVVVEWLLLDGVDAVARGPSVCEQDDLIIDAAADEAHAPLALLHGTATRADVALQPTVGKTMPVGRRMRGRRLAVHITTVPLGRRSPEGPVAVPRWTAAGGCDPDWAQSGRGGVLLELLAQRRGE